MGDKGLVFKLVKSLYVVVLVLGLIGSGLLLVIGVYALTDSEDNANFYENIMRFYGIDEINFEPVANESLSVYNWSTTYPEESYDKQSEKKIEY